VSRVAATRGNDRDELFTVELEADRRRVHTGSAEKLPGESSGARIVGSEPTVGLADKQQPARGDERTTPEPTCLSLPNDLSGARSDRGDRAVDGLLCDWLLVAADPYFTLPGLGMARVSVNAKCVPNTYRRSALGE
jgi:hypothetical protein